MTSKQIIQHISNDVTWQVLSSQVAFFHAHAIAAVEERMHESRLVKKGNRRAVYLHAYGGFYIKQLRTSRAQKEWRNWIRLHAAGMPTVKPVALGLGQRSAYIVSHAHPGFRPLYEIYDTLSGRQRCRLLERLGQAIGRMHELGYYHGDLHGGNFIVRLSTGRFALKILDFQSGSFKRITRPRRFTNLADISLSHFFQLDARGKFAFIKGYWGSSAEAKHFWRKNGRHLEQIILKRATRVADRNARKYRKENKYFGMLASHTGSYKGVYLKKHRATIPEAFLAAPISTIQSDRVEIFKDTRSVRVVRHNDICIKYYKRRGPKDQIRAIVNSSKARKSMHSALAMQNRYIHTPEPFCFLTGKKGDSFYLCRMIAPSKNLTRYLQTAAPEERLDCLRSLSFFLNYMFYRGVYHLDLKGSNILTRGTGKKREFYVIDSDEVVVHWRGSRRLQHKCLLRITRALLPFFDRQALCGFVEQCQTGLSARFPTATGLDMVEQAIERQRHLKGPPKS